MVIRSSSTREIDRLVDRLRDGAPVERETAIARLRVIGARAIDRLAALAGSDAPPVARAAALKALEGMDDPRARAAALERVGDASPAVAAAAVAVLRSWLASDTAVLDTVTALALDKSRPSAVRLAALDVLSELPRSVIQPVLQHVGGENPVLATRAAGDTAAPALDHPVGTKEWLMLRGANAPLSEIHDAIVRIRGRERDEPAARLRQEWQVVRAAAHYVLAQRNSRVALYDLRETLDGAPPTLPVDFLNAVTLIGDASCLEPLARAWSGAGRELWWRDRVAESARAIVSRERLTSRHAAVKRLRARYPGFL